MLNFMLDLYNNAFITAYNNMYSVNVITALDYLGLYAPLIEFFFALFFLRNKFTYLRIYVAGFIFNNILNPLLKLAIKEPRPTKDIRALEIAISNNIDRFGFDKFGMPSGHAQNCAFNLIYLFYVLDDPFVTGLFLILSLVSVYQRYKYFNNTILQLVVGFIIGACLGYVFYICGRKYITGNIKAKADDDAPI
jgi:membrane-associated phospholipid phosphatase